NPVSGDLSVGVEGRRIRNGELAEPVREVTIGSTLPRMLHDVVAVGADTTYFPGDATGVSLAVSDVTMSGTCAAATPPWSPWPGRWSAARRAASRSRSRSVGRRRRR